MWNLRLLPLLAVAAFCLVALKAMALILGGGGGLTGADVASAQSATQVPGPKDAPAPEGAATPAAEATDKDKAGSTEAAAPAPKRAGKASEDLPDGTVIANMPDAIPKTEADLLKSLSDRRTMLEKQRREMEMRENLLKAAEARIEARITELKSIEARIEGELKKQDDERDEQFSRLVRMYSAMKPKVAADVFNRLDLDVLLGIVSRMKPRVMGPILAAMDPVVAQRLTMEIANRGQAANTGAPALPKITGQGPS